MRSPNPRRRPLRVVTVLLTPLLLLLPLVDGAHAQETGGDRAAEAVERIRRLQAEIESVLRDLPPEVRREVERRLTGGQARPMEVMEPTAEPAAPEPTPSEPIPLPVVDAAPGCVPLAAFDSDGDGQVSGRDRFWRYLLLVSAADGGRPQRAATTDLYEAGIRGIEASLGSFSLQEGGRGRITVDRRITLDFDEPGRALQWLAVDADRLARGSGPALLPQEGDEPLTGIQVLEPGQRLRFEDGRVEVIGGCY